MSKGHCEKLFLTTTVAIEALIDLGTQFFDAITTLFNYDIKKSIMAQKLDHDPLVLQPTKIGYLPNILSKGK